MKQADSALIDELAPDFLVPLYAPRHTPWSQILTSSAVWAIIVAQFANSWGFWVLLAWLPTYYQDRFGHALPQAGLYSMLPYAAQGICGMLVGWLADALVFRHGWPLLAVRKAAQATGMLGSAICLLLAVQSDQLTVSVALLTAGQAINTLTLIGVSVSQLDIAPAYAGLVFGLGNTAGSLPGIISVQLSGYLLDLTGHRWSVVFGLSAIIQVICAIFWLIFAKAHQIIV